jgi:hypothetical protein
LLLLKLGRLIVVLLGHELLLWWGIRRSGPLAVEGYFIYLDH